MWWLLAAVPLTSQSALLLRLFVVGKGCVAEMGTIGKLLKARTTAYIAFGMDVKAAETLRHFLLVCPLTSYANAGLPDVILANLARPLPLIGRLSFER